MDELTTIEIPPDLKWSEVWEGGIHLYATALIFGVQYHLDAIEVDEEGHAMEPAYEENLRYIELLDDGSDDENPFCTVELIPGRMHVVYLLPAWKISGKCLPPAVAESLGRHATY